MYESVSDYRRIFFHKPKDLLWKIFIEARALRSQQFLHS